ncbi:MAG TPA: RIP metalloprotease RseP, partial [Terriglobales bacterium]|nr:RIP metalloprotease RseP [Terriglobales bacterium]
GWVPQEPNTVTELEPDMPAAKAGLQVGDEVIAVDGITMHSMRAVIHYLQQTKDRPVEVTVLRNGKEMKFTITPVLTELPNGNKQYRIGFRSNPIHVDELSFVPAVKKSIEQNKRYSFLILELVQKLVKREVSMKHIDGPIGIGRASGEAWRQEGWTPLLALMAAISLNLGIFNLFPIPILDGGVILLLLIESVMRRDISLRIKERIYQAAFLFLILFAVVVIYNDFSKLPGLGKFLP